VPGHSIGGGNGRDECANASATTESEEGLNFSHLIQQIRLESAMHLLKNRQIKVIDVAYEVGYTDPSNFARAFRTFSGFSPYEFRHHAVT
jgi:AraC-like DNA-binding protein